ncbi:uncharacterized protein [Arachis hypogaea]|uniref:uncharacterized protein n=1 Tax=Arachis hypogaea TaxID=3818 RepID=UPI000DECD552|nr:uncharacterized protein LOC112704950 [Arachis hypogaea]
MEGSHQNPPVPTSAIHISFNTDDFKSQTPNLDDLVVISVHMGELTIKKVLLDLGSSANVLFYSTLKKVQVSDKALQPLGGELAGFSGERVPLSGYVWLRTTLGEPPNSKTLDIQFLVVNCVSLYNIILGRPSLNSFGVIVSTIYLCVKFSLQYNTVAKVHADHKEARQCYNVSLKKITWEGILRVYSVYNLESIPSLNEMDPRDNNNHPFLTDDLEKVQLGEKNQYTNIGSAFSAETKQHLEGILKANANLFAWTPVDMPGIDPNFICHKLAVNPNARPIRQKKHNLGTERRIAAAAEIQKLLDACFIREIRFFSWLANVVMVRKSSEKWRMCVDFTDLNKACPKDSYQLPNIDRLVDDTFGYQVLSFMDSYSG